MTSNMRNWWMAGLLVVAVSGCGVSPAPVGPGAPAITAMEAAGKKKDRKAKDKLLTEIRQVMLEALALGDLPDYNEEGWKISGLFLEGRPSKDGWQRFKARLTRTEDGETVKRTYRGSYHIKRGELAQG